MNKGVIYTLTDPRTGLVRYVGQTKNDVHKRYSAHISVSSTWHKRSLVKSWIYELLKLGLKPILEVIDEVPLEELTKKEKEYIKLFMALGANLKNAKDYVIAKCYGYYKYIKKEKKEIIETKKIEEIKKTVLTVDPVFSLNFIKALEKDIALDKTVKIRKKKEKKKKVEKKPKKVSQEWIDFLKRQNNPFYDKIKKELALY